MKVGRLAKRCTIFFRGQNKPFKFSVYVKKSDIWKYSPLPKLSLQPPRKCEGPKRSWSQTESSSALSVSSCRLVSSKTSVWFQGDCDPAGPPQGYQPNLESLSSMLT
ncbi:hypothetical protein E2C01_016130 [Portunus trituberculatus]|uniref:Uncharacterized protein n=1 Tax=Portunus trituberculatus TaxID=210409 RepID=A0A5B7DN97_PORTR|nr:hypothetical protein [Portunus trituberculatus]